MERGSYPAAAGMLSGQKAINVLSQNVANTSTAGYKSQSTIKASFGDYLVSRMSLDPEIAKDGIGTGTYITVNDDQLTILRRAVFSQTGRSVDAAIQGQGFSWFRMPTMARC